MSPKIDSDFECEIHTDAYDAFSISLATPKAVTHLVEPTMPDWMLDPFDENENESVHLSGSECQAPDWNYNGSSSDESLRPAAEVNHADPSLDMGLDMSLPSVDVPERMEAVEKEE